MCPATRHLKNTTHFWQQMHHYETSKNTLHRAFRLWKIGPLDFLKKERKKKTEKYEEMLSLFPIWSTGGENEHTHHLQSGHDLFLIRQFANPPHRSIHFPPIHLHLHHWVQADIISLSIHTRCQWLIQGQFRFQVCCLEPTHVNTFEHQHLFIPQSELKTLQMYLVLRQDWKLTQIRKLLIFNSHLLILT